MIATRGNASENAAAGRRWSLFKRSDPIGSRDGFESQPFTTEASQILFG
jgi:hypothetical protein